VPQRSFLAPQEFTACTEDLACLIDRHRFGHHLYADDTHQLIDSVKILECRHTDYRLTYPGHCDQTVCLKTIATDSGQDSNDLVWYDLRS